MRSLHYRTQSLPESVYTNHMLQLAQQHQVAEYHHHHSRQQQLLQHHQHQLQHHHTQQQQLHNDKLLHATHPSSAIKKRTSVRRSQTNVGDLVSLPSALAHHRAPLTAGVYEAFLPPPNFNAVGLPVDASRLAASHRPRTLTNPSVAARAQSFYLPSSSGSGLHQRTASLSHHYSRLQQQQQQMLFGGGSQHDVSRSAEMMMMSVATQQQQHLQQHHSQQHSYPGLSYPHNSGSSGSLLAVDQKQVNSCSSIASNNNTPAAAPFSWYSQPSLTHQHHRSVPNISSSSSSSLTTPLYVDCSVEYDLGDQPPVPANSEPLLAIHPEYVKGGRKAAIRSLKASPYSLPLYGAGAVPRPAGKLKSAARGSPATVEEALQLQHHHRSLQDIQGNNYTAARRSAAAHQIQRSAAVDGGADTICQKTAMSTSADLMMEAVTRKLSVESRDSGIGLLMHSAGQQQQQQQVVVALKETTNSSCGSHTSCEAAVANNNAAVITASSSSTSSNWQLQQQQHFHHVCDNLQQQQQHYLPQPTAAPAVYPTTAVALKGLQPTPVNNNTKRSAFTGN
jgi:hypothetical protein